MPHTFSHYPRALRRTIRHTAAETAASVAAMVAAMVAAIVAVVSTGAAFSTPVNAQSLPANGTVQQWIDARVASGAHHGIVVGLLEGGKTRVVSAGTANGDGQRRLDATSIFEIGSITKVFTTILLADMVQRGEVALDDPVSRYLPAEVRLPTRSGKVITLLDLATASSGLSAQVSNLILDNPANPFANYRVEQMYALLSATTLTRDPGAQYEYSNLGMGLLGHVLALRAGKSYEALLTERVLAPLGLNETRITLTPNLSARFVTGHDADLEPASAWDLPTLAGAGALRSSMNDMLRFASALTSRDKQPLADAIRMAIEPRRPTTTPNTRIGLGWHIREGANRRIVWHNGRTGGFTSFLGFDPARNVAVVVLSNSTESIDDLALHLLDTTVALRTTAPRPTIAVAPSTLARYVGRFVVAPTFAFTVTREGEKLFVQATNQQRFRLWPINDTSFALRPIPARFHFVRDSSGAPNTLLLDQSGRQIRGVRQP